jgi:polysaccharide deacetylase 2 family uncharacterized protein YibQ
VGRWLAAVLACGLVAASAGAAAPATRPTIAIIIDDVGDGLADGRRAIALPGAAALSILPHTPFGPRLAEEAHQRGKQVMLHLPMEALEALDPEPGEIAADMPALEMAMTLAHDLRSVPHAAGVNNHRGSRLTQNGVAMATLMRVLRAQGPLFFVDSVTSANSLAARTARQQGVPSLARDVFLDNDRDPQAIAGQFERLVDIARRRGHALAIGHPYPETLALLERRLPELAARGILLVEPSAMLEGQTEATAWPVFSSPSPKAQKSSKP